MNSRFYRQFYIRVKSTTDILLACCLLVILSPLLLLIAVSIKLNSNGPVFYRQQRVGLNQKTFFVLKFRSMTVDAGRDESQTLPGCSDVTSVGHVLRRTKLDELPQLLNVIKGDMSLVGPRPCLPSLLHELDTEYLQRFDVKPGLTGFAQVNGNIFITWEERCKYDLHYVRHISPVLDIRIIVKTIAVIFFGEKKFANPNIK